MRIHHSFPLNMHKGMYKFLRMTVTLKCLKIFFQKKIDQTCEKCKGAVSTADYIQVYRNDNIHDLLLHEAMERTWKSGVKLWHALSHPNLVISLVTSTPQRVVNQILEKRMPSNRWIPDPLNRDHNHFKEWSTIWAVTCPICLKIHAVWGISQRRILYSNGQRYMKLSSSCW